MPITALPAAPNRATDTPTAFATKADALLSALAQFVTEANTLQSDCNTQQSTATAQAAAAAVSAANALTAATQAANTLAATQAALGAPKWVSGTYASGVAAWSPSNGLLYRTRSALASSTTDPANDPANWFSLSLQSLPVATVSASGNTLATAGVHYVITAATANLQLPANPNAGDLVGITNASGVATNTLDPNGKTLKGDSSVCALNDLTISAVLKYTTAQGWIKQ